MPSESGGRIVLRVRNDPLGFAHRTLKNLENIERAFEVGADVHVVTQVMLSLLGLVVFPWEKRSFERLLTWSIGTSLVGADRYVWTITKDTYPEKCDSIGQLLRHLRNAVSHNRVVFSSDSRKIEDVSVQFTDLNGQREWCAQITAVDLREFCVGLLNTIWID
jgi:hypothetical protein